MLALNYHANTLKAAKRGWLDMLQVLTAAYGKGSAVLQQVAVGDYHASINDAVARGDTEVFKVLIFI